VSIPAEAVDVPADGPPPRRGLAGQVLALDDRFWIVNTMEMLERLAYYGVRAVIPLYIVLPLELGGPEFTQVQKGTIFAWWAFVQSMLPMYMGGMADRYGHKNTIAAAIILKIVGYVLMAVPASFYLATVGPALFPGAEDPTAAGSTLNFYGFLAACLLLAAGTAIFKPGVQGTLAATMRRSEASVGWAIFYQLVNVGGFLGPVLAGVLRGMSWTYVFFSCAIIVALNLLWLPFYTSPTEEAREASRASDEAAEAGRAASRANFAALSQAVSWPLGVFWAAFWTVVNLALSVGWWLGQVPLDGDNYALFTLMFGIFQVAFYVWLPLKARFDAGRDDLLAVVVVSTVGIFQLRVFFFALAFAGFWLMFNQVFDLLPNVIDDWVDSSDILGGLGWAFSTPVVPAGLGVVFAVLMAGVVAAVILLALRPDRRRPDRVPIGSWVVVGLGLAGALWPVVHVGVTGTGDTALLPVPVGFLPAVSLLFSVAIGMLGGAIGWFARPPAAVVAWVGGGLGLLAWGYVAVSSLLGSSEALLEMSREGGQVNPEWMLNVNAGMIVFTMVFFGYLSGFVRPLTSIIIGMVVAIGGAVLAGTAMLGIACLLGIAVFSIGEMLSSPKKMEFLATLARKGQEGLFMGYANVPVAIGWIAGSIFAGNRYEEIGDKANLARQHLVTEVGLDPERVEALPKSEVVPTLAEQLGMDVLETQRFLFETYDPWWVWVEIGGIGLVSLALMVVYDQVIRALDRREASA
jgi:hypothetical protein